MTRLESLYEEMAKRKMVASKKEFAEKLGFAYANLARYLSGQLKTTIDAENYRKFAESGINIDWLLTGEGEMFEPQTRDEELAAAFGDLLGDPDDSFKKRFISALLKLDLSEWKTIELFCKTIIEERDKEKEDGA